MSCGCKDKAVFKKAIDTVRLLSADAIEKAKSGHPGTPMGAADFGFTLWSKFLRFDPANPDWIGRDRFVLSAGHGSMLLYSLLHLFGYDVTMDDIKDFRQFGSKTPGHPEYGSTPGVEITTGPLGSGLSSAVGMAIGLKQLDARLGSNGLMDQKVYVLCGDGCFMEGASHEACSLAGHLKLDNLIVFYDYNAITIEGATTLALSDDTAARFRSYGWNVIECNGQCPKQIASALNLAKYNAGDKPTLIIGKSTIGYGAPNKAGSAGSHGAPLGADEVAGAKKNLGFDPEQSFYIPEDVKELCAKFVDDKKAEAAQWNAKFDAFKAGASAETKALMDALLNKTVPADILTRLQAAVSDKATATRISGGEILQIAADAVPALVGGSADLAPSTKTYIKGGGNFGADDRAGRNIYYGIRELAMGFINNGIALTYTIPLCSTFFVFSDYMKPAIRLAAIMKLHQIYIFTHDSFAVGEDGATHQPIEQLAMFRGIPGVTVLRPADYSEVAGAWATALLADGPVIICLTRQNIPCLPAEAKAKVDVSKGAYVISDDADADIAIIATGSEVCLALSAADLLRAKGKKIRVISMPSWELFDKQSAEYKESVLPKAIEKRVSLEAGSTFGWTKYTCCDGLNLGIDHFGSSAPFERLCQEYGFTPEAVAKAIEEKF